MHFCISIVNILVFLAAPPKPEQEQLEMNGITSESEDMELPTYREVPLSQQSQQAQQAHLKQQLDYLKNVYNLPDKVRQHVIFTVLVKSCYDVKQVH